jgi:hypothetical protein
MNVLLMLPRWFEVAPDLRDPSGRHYGHRATDNSSKKSIQFRDVQDAVVPVLGMVVDAIQEELFQPGYLAVVQWLVEIIHLIRHLMLNAKPGSQGVDRAGIGT